MEQVNAQVILISGAKYISFNNPYNKTIVVSFDNAALPDITLAAGETSNILYQSPLCWDTFCLIEDPVNMLIRKCGCLPEVELTRMFDSSSNNQTNQSNDSYDIDSVHHFIDDNADVCATLEQSAVASDYSFVRPSSGQTTLHARPDRLFAIDNMAPFTSTAPVDWQFQLEFVELINKDINGCVSTYRTEICLEDVDNGSVITNLSQPWTNESQLNPQTGSGYTENPTGTFTFDTQANYYLCWNDTNNVTLDYRQATGDGIGISAKVFITQAVEYFCDESGAIVSAETSDGPLPEARWGEIVEKVTLEGS